MRYSHHHEPSEPALAGEPTPVAEADAHHAPPGLLGREPGVLVVHPSMPAKSVAELIAANQSIEEIRRFVEAERNWAGSVGRYRQVYQRVAGKAELAHVPA